MVFLQLRILVDLHFQVIPEQEPLPLPLKTPVSSADQAEMSQGEDTVLDGMYCFESVWVC
jgi:hypothetical protein